MTVQLHNDLVAFHEFVGKQLANGGAKLSPEQVLALWRDRLDTIESVRRGLADVEAGLTRPAEEVIRQLREELEHR